MNTSRFVQGYMDRPWMFCSENCKVAYVTGLGRSAWLDGVHDADQLKLWTDCATEEGCLECGAAIPSPIPADAVFVLAKVDAQRAGYYGFNCQPVEQIGDIHIVACPRQHVDWMIGRLASGMQLVRGRLEFGEWYPGIRSAREDARELAALAVR